VVDKSRTLLMVFLGLIGVPIAMLSGLNLLGALLVGHLS
jgi:hypothetical protein